MMRLITIISIVVYIIGCHGDIKITDYELKSPIYGSWIHKFSSDPSNGSMMIYNFLSSNRLEKKTYIQGHPIHKDTTHYFGSYQIPSPNLLYEYIYYHIESDTIVKRVYQSDTLIFEIEEGDLQLSFSGRTYKQLSGKPNQLLGGQFYDVTLIDTVGQYLHEMNHFSDDTVHSYATINYSSSLPQIWDFYTLYTYTFTDRFIVMTPWRRPGTILRGYKFYKGDLILGYGRVLFKKFYDVNNQPNSGFKPTGRAGRFLKI